MALATVHPAAAAGLLLQAGRGEDIATRVDVFEEIYLVFLALGTLVGVVVIAYTLQKAYKYRAGTGNDYDVARPELGELPTGSEKGGRKLFLSFTLSAIIVLSLIAWTYGWLLYVETGTAEVPEDGVEATVVGEDFAWEFQYRDDERVSPDQMEGYVDELGRQAVLDAIREAEANESLTLEQAIAARLDEARDDETVTAADVATGPRSVGTFRVPVDREVHLDVTSGDVWHNFGIPAFRAKADAIPGEVTETWFVAEEPGEYSAACYELCGSGHSGMRATVIVMTQEEFDSWYANQTVSIDELAAQLESGEFASDESDSSDDPSGSAARTGASSAGDASGSTGEAATPRGVIGA